jgi:Phasin protein
MTKRKPATSPKHVRKPKPVAKAHRSAPDVVRSSKHGPQATVTGEIESLVHQIGDESKENAVAGQDASRQAITPLNEAFGFASASAKFQAYQTKLLEMAQADLEFSLDFGRKLATVKSPLEFPGVLAEFASRRISMFRKYSKDMIEISSQRRRPEAR